MRMYDIISRKRENTELTEREIEFIVSGVTDGTVPDYQLSAFLMAVCFNGMTDRETHLLTDAMARSGDILDLSELGEYSVDKHSTGGVGDKTTLVVAPTVAELGCTVAKLSGRGLGHTGGTVDKLESVKGFDADVGPERFMEIARECGLCVSGAGKNLAPADKKLYALRDVTATVKSIPLIVSSIMSKKLAGGAGTIVLDVKVGSGAFMETLGEARELAARMVEIGKMAGKKCSAVITNMSSPLGREIGNACEVKEAIELLKGSETADKRLREVCVTLASEMVAKSKSIGFDSALKLVNQTLDSGSAYERFKKWIALQGGDVSALESPSFGKSLYETTLVSPCDGYISSVNASKMGLSAMLLGAGRAKKEDVIDPTAGVRILARVGDYVKRGEPLATFCSSTVSDHTEPHALWLSSLSFSDVPPACEAAVYEIIR